MLNAVLIIVIVAAFITDGIIIACVLKDIYAMKKERKILENKMQEVLETQVLKKNRGVASLQFNDGADDCFYSLVSKYFNSYYIAREKNIEKRIEVIIKKAVEAVEEEEIPPLKDPDLGIDIPEFLRNHNPSSSEEEK